MLGPPKVRDLDHPVLVSLEAWVPKDELYCQLERKLDLYFIREWVKESYADSGEFCLVIKRGGQMVTCCNPEDRGPHVVAASFERGYLHEKLRFHSADRFFVHILLDPRRHGLTIPQRTIALGYHTAGTTEISFRLGTLKPGQYAVVITPQDVTLATMPTQAATWVYFTAKPNGKFANIKLVNY